MTYSPAFREALELYRAGNLAAAGEVCLQALRSVPDDSSLLNLMGDVLQAQGRLDEAVHSYRRALHAEPRLHAAWYSAGCACLTKGEYAEASSLLGKAVELAPDHAGSQHNLGNALFQLGMVDEALERFQRALRLRDSFLSRTAIATAIPGGPSRTHGDVLEARRNWAETHLPACPQGPVPNDSPDGRRLRVGYLSSFFQYSNWMKPVWGVVRHHDRRQVELHLFSDCPLSQCANAYEPGTGDQFHDLSGLSNRAAADLIEACRLDILVDLNGFSHVPRLAVVALKPAPVVVGWFNSYATSGMQCFDYIVGDPTVIPPEEERFYSERVVRVPGCYLSFEVRYPVPDVADPPVRELGHITFGSLASQYKLTPEVIAVWADILRQCPGTRLFLKNAALGSAANRTSLQQRFESRGVAPDRIICEGPSEHYQFLAAYDRIDIALDPFPYNGGTTTSEALWQGVPVLTFHGDRWASRQSASILRAAGLNEFVADDSGAYVDAAVRMAQDANIGEKLATLRHTMRQRLAASTACNTAGLATSLEGLFRQMAGKNSPCA